MAQTAITVQTGATVNGSLYAQTAVTLDQNTITGALGTSNSSNSSGNTTAMVTLSVAPYYPQGANNEQYVFVCNASGFTPTSYDWMFGDGQQLFGMTTNNVYHSYGANGTYAVVCDANNASGMVDNDTINVIVS